MIKILHRIVTILATSSALTATAIAASPTFPDIVVTGKITQGPTAARLDIRQIATPNGAPLMIESSTKAAAAVGNAGIAYYVASSTPVSPRTNYPGISLLGCDPLLNANCYTNGIGGVFNTAFGSSRRSQNGQFNLIFDSSFGRANYFFNIFGPGPSFSPSWTPMSISTDNISMGVGDLFIGPPDAIQNGGNAELDLFNAVGQGWSWISLNNGSNTFVLSDNAVGNPVQITRGAPDHTLLLNNDGSIFTRAPMRLISDPSGNDIYSAYSPGPHT